MQEQHLRQIEACVHECATSVGADAVKRPRATKPLHRTSRTPLRTFSRSFAKGRVPPPPPSPLFLPLLPPSPSLYSIMAYKNFSPPPPALQSSSPSVPFWYFGPRPPFFPLTPWELQRRVPFWYYGPRPPTCRRCVGVFQSFSHSACRQPLGAALAKFCEV